MNTFNRAAIISLPPQDLIRPPGALAILAAACNEHNVDYSLFDFNLWLYKNNSKEDWTNINDNWSAIDPFDELSSIFKIKLQEYVELIMRSKPDLIAISIFYDLCSFSAIELINLLNRRSDRNTFKIVVGGTGIRAKLPLYDHKDLCLALLDQTLIDFYIFGEGEIAFRELLQGNAYPGINNFDAVQIDDLNQFVFPDYSKISPFDYKFMAHPEVIITGSRGCVRKCTYCNVAKYWPKYRYRSGQSIARELIHYYEKLGISHFEFSDSLINGSLKTFKEMNKTLVEYRQQNPEFKISYKGQYICRPQSSMKEQDYIDMKLAGCDYIYVGVESFSDRVRHDMLKKFNNTDLEFHLKMCGKYGIKNAFLMLVGYPTETEKDHQKNLEMLKIYQKYAQAGIIAMITFGYTATILEDTPLFHQQEKLHIVSEFDTSVSGIAENWISLDNPSLTLAKRIERWLELVRLASDLGYTMPRVQHHVAKFIKFLTINKKKNKKIYAITSD